MNIQAQQLNRPQLPTNNTKPPVVKESSQVLDRIKRNQEVSQIKVIKELYSAKADRLADSLQEARFASYEATGRRRLERIEQGKIVDLKC